MRCKYALWDQTVLRRCQIHPDYLDESIDTQPITITTLLRAKEHTFGAHLCVYMCLSVKI